MDLHDEIDEFAREIELAIREFDEALRRHERACHTTPRYSESTSLWDKVKDELHS